MTQQEAEGKNYLFTIPGDHSQLLGLDDEFDIAPYSKLIAENINANA